MNISLLIGLIGGTLLIAVSCFLAGSLKAFFNFPSILIVFGGTAASAMVAFQFSTLKDAYTLSLSLFRKKELDIKALITFFTECSKNIKKNGKLGLDKMNPHDPFLKKGLDYVMANQSAEVIEKILSQERETLFAREIQSQKVIDKLGEYSPAWGMIGTLIGLVVMMLNLSDPSQIGPSMAVALLTTFYGAMLSNLFFLPLSYKAEVRINENFLLREIIIEGLSALAREENPRMIEDRLMAFIHHDQTSKQQPSMNPKPVLAT